MSILTRRYHAVRHLAILRGPFALYPPNAAGLGSITETIGGLRAIQIGLASLLFKTEVTFRFVVVQKDAPYRVEVFELEDEFIEIGVEDYLRDIRRFAECQSTGIWQPAKYGEVQTLKTPPYRQLDRQLAWRTPDGGTGFSDDGYTED